MEGMRVIGLMGSMMGMGWRAGQGGADTGDNTGWVCVMDSGCISSIMEIAMPGSGSAGRAMGVECQTCSDGSCYVGEFMCGVKHGLGYYHFRSDEISNGDEYSGEYFGDKIHGFGVYHFANGHCYVGSWHEGRRQGFGTYTFRNGEMRSGEWDCGVLKIPLLPSDPAAQRAVQAARKAAENAVLLARVDEQVNKAVAAANRAAIAARVAAVKAIQNQMDAKFYYTNM
ncbi:phosphatidylinositol 4-phosphate 5-kinase 5-like [Phoenix dactylifera]|uniref:Phosphatidylinositol 4-phosphate 5-kinase 5-like n=1 Tax=Phoenix dactylifera TaxID=42345 RepID=A0A8B8ZRH6_PHODC|nr:phosphatidylinositol 4-phosphate 5-kinase 5-like [Phoenix dactylifera]